MSNTREAPAPSQLYSFSQTNQIVVRQIARVWWGFFFSGRIFSRIVCLTSYFEEWVFEKSL
jgi:hypothetical protein